MNKFVYLVALATIFMFGCSKEKIKEQSGNNDNANSSIKLITLSNGNRTTINMLKFPSTEAYDFTITNLEQQMETLDDAFLNQYGYLNDNLLNDKEDEVGFVYQQPLIDFENSLNFTNSMRQVFVVAEENWLDNDSLDPSTDPSNIYTFGNAEMAMLNEGGEVKIGTSLLKLTKDGFVEFTDGDVNKLVRFNNGDMSVLNEPNVVTNIDEASRSADCKSWKGEENWDEYVRNKKKVKMHEHFHAYPWKGTSEAQITSYKKKGHRWKRYRINLGVANESAFYDNNDCDNLLYQGWRGWKRKRRKSLSRHNASWGSFPMYRAENNLSVVGYYEYAGHSNNDVLSW